MPSAVSVTWGMNDRKSSRCNQQPASADKKKLTRLAHGFRQEVKTTQETKMSVNYPTRKFH